MSKDKNEFTRSTLCPVSYTVNTELNGGRMEDGQL